MKYSIDKKLNIISIKNFYTIDDIERNEINFELEKNYLKFYNPKIGYNYSILEYKNLFFKNFYDKFLKISYEIFGNFSLLEKNKNNCWCYKSLLDDYVSEYHNHINTSTINGVYYYQISKDDSISFFDYEKNEITYYPEQNEILIFPNHLVHKPNKPSDKSFGKCRYSINVEIFTKESSIELFSRI